MKRLLCVVLLLSFLTPSALGKQIVVDVSSDFDQEEIPETIELVYRGHDVFQIQGMNRLVTRIDPPVTAVVQSRVNAWNAVLDQMNPDIPVYLYFADDCRTHPFAREFSEDSEMYIYLKENFHVDACDHLKYSSFAQYCSYYYSTDHHWNFRGSYQGYVDIVHMMLGPDEKVLVPTGIQVTDVTFNGSLAKYIKDPISQQKFAYYLFDDYPEYKSVIEGKNRRYGNRKNYLDNKYGKQTYASHYASFYGGNFGLIEMYSKEKGLDKNLLIIGDSFSNAVLAMLMNHYKSVIFVDLRHYQYATRKRFSMSGVTKKYKIDQVLFLGAFPLFGYDDFQDINP